MGQLPPAPVITQVPLLTPIVSHPALPPLVPVSTTSTNTQAITPVAIQPSTSITLTSPLPTPVNSNEPTIMPTMPVGMFMGDSMLPLPDSIVAKIRKLEFVDMSELRPESWLLDEEAEEKSVPALFKTKKKPVTDILIWVQCFASHVAVLAQSFPAHTPNLWLTYLATIVRCHHRFEGLSWVQTSSSKSERPQLVCHRPIVIQQYIHRQSKSNN